MSDNAMESKFAVGFDCEECKYYNLIYKLGKKNFCFGCDAPFGCVYKQEQDKKSEE